MEELKFTLKKIISIYLILDVIAYCYQRYQVLKLMWYSSKKSRAFLLRYYKQFKSYKYKTGKSEIFMDKKNYILILP